jgi:YVTN family beta-propeller protein
MLWHTPTDTPMLALSLFLLQATVPQPPQRAVTDPGVFAVGQRVTPAGVQSVFDGRVAGVRFGAGAGELWTIVPNNAWALAWRDGRVLARATFNGRPGVHGIIIDPVTRRPIIASVGKLPADVAASRTPGGPPLSRAKSVAQLVSYAADSTARIVSASGPLGDFMAGGPSVASHKGTDGRRVAIVPLPADDKLTILDADNGAVLRTVPLGVLPIASALSPNGATAWVTVFGGPKPTTTSRRATQCCDPAAEPVRVNARGIALPGTVERVDVARGTVTHRITVGTHPTGLVWDHARQRLYVANGNSDNISVIDTRTNTLATTITIAPFRERKIGLTPTALALSPNGQSLYVTLGGANALAIYRVGTANSALATFAGLVPTGWYPSSVDVSADGSTIAVGTLFGVGSGTGKTNGQEGRYVFAERGSVNVIPVPTESELAAFTVSVAENNRLHLVGGSAAPSIAPRTAARARPVPERPGEPSPIQHVVYIIKENRTYDQVLGDIGKGASDPRLTMYGRDVTPNTHALSEQFVLFDHFFASGGNSADGHNWLTQANETAYPMWPLYYGRSYPSEGNDPLTYSSGGFLWESAQAKGKRVVSFGEYAPAPSDSVPNARATLMAMYRDSTKYSPTFARQTLKSLYNTRSEIPSLDRILVREYPGWTQEVPDVVKADVFIAHLTEWEQRKQMPHLTLMILPNDHTQGTSSGWCTPAACVADNDLALGKIVEALSHSSFWKSMAILVVEDDAQNGVDHIDGHRTVAMVASPYAKRRVIDSTFYSQPSMVKTIELMLGLPALSLFDLVATDMRAAFLGPSDRPDFTPYSAILPRQSLYDVNRKVSEITGPHAAGHRAAAVASARMNFREPDAAPTERLNRILWHAAKGFTTPYPTVKRSLFFPLAVDIDDDDREEVEDRRDTKVRSTRKTSPTPSRNPLR